MSRVINVVVTLINPSNTNVEIIRQTVNSYRRMIDETQSQLTDEEFFERPSGKVNSVAIILRHLGGNLVSRWTDFLTTDGEKPTRNRDLEFADWEKSRVELMEYFDTGWNVFTKAISEISDENIDAQIFIRGEPHTVMQALVRSLTHVTYHTGQIALVARLVHDGEWNWLTIPPDKSSEFNQETWGTSKSRAVFDSDENA